MIVTVVKPRPRFQTQRNAADKFGPLNCTAYAAAMGIEFATCGNLSVTGRDIRALSDEPEPEPDSPGLNLRQVVDVSRKLRCPLTDQTGRAWETLTGYIDAGMGIILQGSGPAMAEWQDVPFTGPHAVLVTEATPRTMTVWNPLNSKAVSVPATAVRTFALGLKTSATGLRFATTRTAPLVGTIKL